MSGNRRQGEERAALAGDRAVIHRPGCFPAIVEIWVGREWACMRVEGVAGSFFELPAEAFGGRRPWP